MTSCSQDDTISPNQSNDTYPAISARTASVDDTVTAFLSRDTGLSRRRHSEKQHRTRKRNVASTFLWRHSVTRNKEPPPQQQQCFLLNDDDMIDNDAQVGVMQCRHNASFTSSGNEPADQSTLEQCRSQAEQNSPVSRRESTTSERVVSTVNHVANTVRQTPIFVLTTDHDEPQTEDSPRHTEPACGAFHQTNLNDVRSASPGDSEQDEVPRLHKSVSLFNANQIANSCYATGEQTSQADVSELGHGNQHKQHRSQSSSNVTTISNGVAPIATRLSQSALISRDNTLLPRQPPHSHSNGVTKAPTTSFRSIMLKHQDPAASPCATPTFRGLVHKHKAAFKVAGILMAKREEKNTVRTEQKAIKVLGTMFIIFVVCWAPFFTINFTMGVCAVCNIDVIVFKVFLWCGYFGSTLNPIIYTVFNKKFRHFFLSRLTCGRSTSGSFTPAQPTSLKHAAAARHTSAQKTNNRTRGWCTKLTSIFARRQKPGDVMDSKSENETDSNAAARPLNDTAL